MTSNHTDAVAPGIMQRAIMYQPLLDYFDETVWSRSLKDFVTSRPFTHFVFSLGVIRVQAINVAPHGENQTIDPNAPRAALIYIADTASDADAIAFGLEFGTATGFHLVDVKSGLSAEQVTPQLEEQRFRRYAGLFEQLGTRWPKSLERVAELAQEVANGN